MIFMFISLLPVFFSLVLWSIEITATKSDPFLELGAGSDGKEENRTKAQLCLVRF